MQTDREVPKGRTEQRDGRLWIVACPFANSTKQRLNNRLSIGRGGRYLHGSKREDGRPYLRRHQGRSDGIKESIWMMEDNGGFRGEGVYVV